MKLKFYTSVTKRLKLKVKKFWNLAPTFVAVTGEKLVVGGGGGGGGGFCPHPLCHLILNRVNPCFQFIMLGGNCALYRCSSMSAIQVVLQYRGNNEETTLLQLLLVLA